MPAGCCLDLKQIQSTKYMTKTNKQTVLENNFRRVYCLNMAGGTQSECSSVNKPGSFKYIMNQRPLRGSALKLLRGIQCKMYWGNDDVIKTCCKFFINSIVFISNNQNCSSISSLVARQKKAIYTDDRSCFGSSSRACTRGITLL